MNNELYKITLNNRTIRTSRSNLLNANEYTPFIIRIFESKLLKWKLLKILKRRILSAESIEMQLVGERKPFLQAQTAQTTPINVAWISFGTVKDSICNWLYGCQVDPTAPMWPLNEPVHSCERIPSSGAFLRISEYNSSPDHENIVLKVYVATSADTVNVRLSSVDYSSSVRPHYDIGMAPKCLILNILH